MKMKRLVILGSLLLGLNNLFAHEGILHNSQSSSSDAENSGTYIPYKPKIGFFVAPSIDWMSSKSNKNIAQSFETNSYESTVGFKMGLTIDKYINHWLVVSTGVHYNQVKGNLMTRRMSGSSYESNTINKADMYYKLSYLDIPLHLKYLSPYLFEHFKIFAGAGLGVSIAIHKQVSMDLDYNDKYGIRNTYQQDYESLEGWTKNTAPITMFWDIGMGAQYDIDYKRAVYFGVYYQNMFLPDLTRDKKFNFPTIGSLNFNDGNVSGHHVAFRLGIIF